jgi:hypothetical protein
MPSPTADSGEQLSPTERRQQVAAILALGVLRYCRIARLAGSEELSESRPQGLEVVSKARLSVSRGRSTASASTKGDRT